MIRNYLNSVSTAWWAARGSNPGPIPYSADFVTGLAPSTDSQRTHNEIDGERHLEQARKLYNAMGATRLAERLGD